jgi:hypothetical protein
MRQKSLKCIKSGAEARNQNLNIIFPIIIFHFQAVLTIYEQQLQKNKMLGIADCNEAIKIFNSLQKGIFYELSVWLIEG